MTVNDVGRVYTFKPVGLDAWRSPAVPAGTKVRIVGLTGDPEHVHIQTLDGNYAGRVLTNSLVPVQEASSPSDGGETK